MLLDIKHMNIHNYMQLNIINLVISALYALGYNMEHTPPLNWTFFLLRVPTVTLRSKSEYIICFNIQSVRS